jgi:hypothetical protein
MRGSVDRARHVRRSRVSAVSPVLVAAIMQLSLVAGGRAGAGVPSMAPTMRCRGRASGASPSGAPARRRPPATRRPLDLPRRRPGAASSEQMPARHLVRYQQGRRRAILLPADQAGARAPEMREDADALSLRREPRPHRQATACMRSACGGDERAIPSVGRTGHAFPPTRHEPDTRARRNQGCAALSGLPPGPIRPAQSVRLACRGLFGRLPGRS